MLAVAYDEFSSCARDKFKKLYLHRRLAINSAFHLLTSKQEPKEISFKNFQGVVSLIKPSISTLRCYLMFKVLDKNRCGYINIKEFSGIYECLELNWTQEFPVIKWYSGFPKKVQSMLKLFSLVASSVFLEKAINIIIIISFLWELVLNSSLSPYLATQFRWVQTSLIHLYFAEAIVKIIGLGPIHYSTNGWNPFDFIIMIVSMCGHYFKPSGIDMGYLYVIRTFRILQLFERTRRYNDIMGPFIFIVIRQLVNFSLILGVVIYSYAVMGMEFFAQADLDNPAPEVVAPEVNYALNNFTDILSSMVTLFVFIFGYTWFFLMQRYVDLVGPWYRVYFMTFYILAMVILTIVVASILEAFLFSISWRRGVSGNNDHMTVKVHMFLDDTELTSLGVEPNENSTTRSATFQGQKLRSKFSFSAQKYAYEIDHWEAEFDKQNGSQHAVVRRRRRTASARL
ncbi:Two pore calcium channel protein 1 [Halotydeus destructor]|nr:Two pore calcium channel protein 1 [Halotydeus destructor]